MGARAIPDWKVLAVPAGRTTLDVGVLRLLVRDPERDPQASIGIRPQTAGGFASVESVDERSPAHLAGIMPGDRLLAIGTLDVRDLGMEALRFLLGGPAGSPVSLCVRRGEGEATYTLTRR
jgi:C-terminal processing protease CtpA/Prc